MKNTIDIRDVTDYESFAKLLDQVDNMDEFGFTQFKHNYWELETDQEELKRLELNQAIYREMLKYRTRFPPHIKKERTEEFQRVRYLRERLGGGHA